MKKTLTAVLAAMLMLALCCGSALAYTGDITTSNAKAYADPEMTQLVGAIPAGTSVLVRSYDAYADVYYNGKVVYLAPSDLLNGDITGDYNAVLLKGTKIYQRAATSAKSQKLKKDVNVNVCAVSGDWALVRTTGDLTLFAFVKVGKLTNISPN